MALGANTKRALNIALAQHGAGVELATAVDLNTAKTSMPTLSELSTTTTEATTTFLHTALKSLVADMQSEGHMA